jgi:hypothetical protein
MAFGDPGDRDGGWSPDVGRERGYLSDHPLHGGDEDTGMGDDLLNYGEFAGGIPSSAYSTVMGEDEQGRVTSWFNPQATWKDWFAAPFETIGQFFGADPQFGRHDVFGIPGQTSRDFTRAASGLYGPQEPWSVEASPLGGILGTVGVRLAPEEGQSRIFGYSPSQPGEQTDFTFKDLLPGSGVENKPIYDDENVGQVVGSAQRPVLPPYLRSGIGTLSADVGNPLLQRAGIKIEPKEGVQDPLVAPSTRRWEDYSPYEKNEYMRDLRKDPRIEQLLEDAQKPEDDVYERRTLPPGWKLYDPDPEGIEGWQGNPYKMKGFSLNQGGPVVKQYEDGGPAVADQQIPKIPMEATGIVAGLLDVQRKGSTEDIVGFVQTHRGDLEYLAKIDDPRFDIVRSTLIQFGAPAVPAPPQIKPRRSLLPSERILRDILSAQEEQRMSEQDLFSLQEHVPAMSSEEIMQQTKPGFSGVADQGFTLGGPISGDVFPPQMQRGGHVGRGTMAGELAPRGSLPVREAGESMYERFKRMHGDGQDYQGGGPVHHGPSSGVRRLKESVLSPSMQRRIFG